MIGQKQQGEASMAGGAVRPAATPHAETPTQFITMRFGEDPGDAANRALRDMIR
jgi:hypothetical protein